MPTATTPLIQLPIPQIPAMAPDGRMTKEMYDYLKALDALVRALRLEIP
jgi:hypothetical protein